MRSVHVKAHIQYIDFEGRSDGESLIKILSQLRPRRVIVIRGNVESTVTIQNHCREQVGARVFAPNRGEIVDATTESHIYQVRLTDALVSQLQFQKGKNGAELSWFDGQIGIREVAQDVKPASREESEPMEGKSGY